MLVDKINHGICIKNIEKIKQSYSPYIVTFADLNAPKYFEELANDHVAINTRDEMTSIFGMLVFLQLMAFNCAKLLNRNIDKPTGLSKVVKT